MGRLLLFFCVQEENRSLDTRAEESLTSLARCGRESFSEGLMLLLWRLSKRRARALDQVRA
jgi:hypothetical protein